jgi:UDP-2,4-diacetamido-2,4,6-trideoxy-beta-L-altropyranose hydrolase
LEIKVAIRVDASTRIGTGHVMRCLALARALREKSVRIVFVSRPGAGDLISFVSDQGFEVRALKHASPHENDAGGGAYSEWLGASVETDARESSACLKTDAPWDWLLVDHYALDARWEKIVKERARKIFVIDDLANRPHVCDALLDQNLQTDMDTRYQSLVPASCRLLLGPRFALLRPEFYEARFQLKQRDGAVRKVLIFFGGVDTTNETEKTLRAFRQLQPFNLSLDVVVTSANPNAETIRRLCAELPAARFHRDVQNMAALMTQSDLAVGAGGVTSWERCYLGLPSILLVLADNQTGPAEALAARGAAWNLGPRARVDADDIAKAVRRALENPAELRKMSATALAIMANGGEHEDENAVVKTILEDVHAAR